MVCVKRRYHTYSMEKTISEILHGRTGWSRCSSFFVWERGVIHFVANKVLHINYSAVSVITTQGLVLSFYTAAVNIG